jgi:hypothetical protein
VVGPLGEFGAPFRDADSTRPQLRALTAIGLLRPGGRTRPRRQDRQRMHFGGLVCARRTMARLRLEPFPAVLPQTGFQLLALDG